MNEFFSFISDEHLLSIDAEPYSVPYFNNRVLLTVHGENLDSVQTAALLVNVVKDESPGVVEKTTTIYK